MFLQFEHQWKYHKNPWPNNETEREELQKLIDDARRKEERDPSRIYFCKVHGSHWGWYIKYKGFKIFL